uniref:Putative lipocalin-3 1 n=1 Tax=Amblyomma americanum TaxID=6943 RepID=A0A0C9SFF0_AMBAM
MGEAHFAKNVMAERQFVLVVISTLLFAAAQAESGNTGDGQEVNIKKFLQESHTIIVYQATEGGNKTCIADDYSTVTESHAVFKRHFTEGTKRSSFRLKGVFGPVQEGESRLTKMTVYMVEKNGTQLSEETMIFFSLTGNCGVFNVIDYTDNNKTWHDVRIKNGANLDHTPCLNFYNGIPQKTPSRPVYVKSCPQVPSDSN